MNKQETTWDTSEIPLNYENLCLFYDICKILLFNVLMLILKKYVPNHKYFSLRITLFRYKLLINISHIWITFSLADNMDQTLYISLYIWRG